MWVKKKNRKTTTTNRWKVSTKFTFNPQYVPLKKCGPTSQECSTWRVQFNPKMFGKCFHLASLPPVVLLATPGSCSCRAPGYLSGIYFRVKLDVQYEHSKEKSRILLFFSFLVVAGRWSIWGEDGGCNVIGSTTEHAPCHFRIDHLSTFCFARFRLVSDLATKTFAQSEPKWKWHTKEESLLIQGVGHDDWSSVEDVARIEQAWRSMSSTH